MPRFLVTNGSYFEPFSYEELVAPVAQAQEEYNKTQDAYDKLSLETNALGQYISDNPGDANAKELYDSYVEKLTTLQNNLWNTGYNSQTRRDLSVAREGYARDITRLTTAIRNRQERSKEYWDAKHKNPDLIMGSDPGLAGLDTYLSNSEYGRDYYTYSGRQFMEEVGADAKNRANELLRDPVYSRNPQLAGYITRIAQDGFTSSEVAAASNAVAEAIASGNNDALANLGIAESLLADVLMSHLDSTGAKDNVSPEEYDRLFEYGRAGLSSAIGKGISSDLADKEWEYRTRATLAGAGARRVSGGSATIKPKNPENPVEPYALNDISTYMEADNADEIGTLIKENFVDSVEQPILVRNNDGTTSYIYNSLDAAAILDSFGRQALVQKYGIPDPDGQLLNKEFKMPDGTMARLSVGLYEGTNQTVFQVKNNGKWVTDGQLTYQWKQDHAAYRKAYNDWAKNNEGVDLFKLAISGEKRKKIYDKYGITYDIPIEYVPAILGTLMKRGRVTYATIAGSTADMAATRNNYISQIITSFNRAADKGKVSNNSEYAFYEVNGYHINDKGVGDISKVLTNDSVINEIVVLPDDLVKNKVRVMIDGKTWAIDPIMLGNDMNSQVQSMRKAVIAMMRPILDPVYAVKMSSAAIQGWRDITKQLIGYYFPYADSVTPRDIVFDPELQANLRSAVTAYMNRVLAEARDNMMQNNMQVHGNTSTKSTGYNDDIPVEETEYED